MARQSRTRFRIDRVDVALFFLVLTLSAPIVQPLGAQQASRLALTAAVWDDRSIWIDGYPLGVDQAEHDGHVVSDKSPGQPLAAVPAYGVYRLLGGDPAKDLRVEANLALWWVSLWSSAIPSGALALLVRRVASRSTPAGATFAALAVCVSSLVLPFSTLLFGHVLSALLALAAWYVLSADEELSGTDLALGGALVGAGVLVEYTMGIAAIILLAQAAARVRRRVWWMIAGAIPAAALLASYQWAAFGSPLAFSYQRTTFSEQAAGLDGARLERSVLDVAWRVLFSDRGLVLATPVVAAGVFGMVVLVRRSRGLQRSAHMSALAIAACLILVQCVWGNATGGDSPGPRYATAAAPFVAPGIALAWTRWRATMTAAAVIGALLMVSAAWTDPIVHPDFDGVAGYWIGRLLRGDWSLTIYEVAIRQSGARLLLPGLTAVAGYCLWRATRQEIAALTPDHAIPASDP